MEETHIINAYDIEINKLNELTGFMASGVLDILEISTELLSDLNSDVNYRLQAKTKDKELNKLELIIENKAMNLLALWQPVAVDLRKVTGAISMAMIFERMGDLGKNTCKRLSKISSLHNNIIEENMKLMLSNLIGNFKLLYTECLPSYDQTIAEKVIINDLTINKLHKILIKELSFSMSNYPLKVEQLLQILLSVKNIERMGDYIVKVAKIIYFIKTGEIKQKITKNEK